MAFCACLVAARTQAQELPRLMVDLNYEVDPALQGCPSVVEFRSIVAQQLGYDPYSARATLSVEVHVRSNETRIDGTIDWTIGAANKLGERRFASRIEDCREMVATVGFVVAVQIQLMATQKALAPARQSEPEPKLRLGSEPNQLSAPRGRDAEVVTLTVKSFGVRPSWFGATNWSAIAGLGPSVGFGLGPVPVAQGRLFLALQTGWAGLEAGAEASLPSVTREAYGGGFRHELLFGTLAACGWHVSTAICALGKVGQLQVRGEGVDKRASPDGLVAQIGPRLAYSLRLGSHLALLGHIDGLYLLTPWTVDLNHVTVWTMPRFSAVAGIDLAARFR